jgi:hypothetical protein
VENLYEKTRTNAIIQDELPLAQGIRNLICKNPYFFKIKDLSTW